MPSSLFTRSLRPTNTLTSFIHRYHRATTPSRSFTMSETINRNPHPDFKQVEASRPDWDAKSTFRYTKTPAPEWKFGDGANNIESASSAAHGHVAIDPYEEGRAGANNYKLLISAITPRPIAFISTRSADGKTTNLAPFSYFNVMNHDPPMFVVGFASPMAAAKDTLRNIMDTKECVINIISEPFIEAANSTSVDAPYGISEWDVSGLTPDYSCKTVQCARVKEAIFSIEAKLDMFKEWESPATGKKTGTMAIFEGKHFWVREDALNADKNIVAPEILRPMGRMGGITYSRTTEAIELPRPKFQEDLGGEAGAEKIKESKQ